MNRSLPHSVFRSGERMVVVTMACALGCLLLSIAVGAVGALAYVPDLGHRLAAAGLSLDRVRPMHTTFASAWLYVGCVACMYAYLFRGSSGPDAGERRRYRVHMVCWGLAGLAALVTLPFGITSGREYLGFHPAISVLVLVGWLVFLRTWIGRVRHGFWGRPVYVYMWTSGALFFVYTFTEGHAYLLPFVGSHPVADLQIQWKSCGTLVASFNQMVYGSLIFVGERTSGDRRMGQSKMAFALFGIGLLNSFTNYAHHTYHLPQAHLIKWVAFVVSMLEILILWNLLADIVAKTGRRRGLQARFVTTDHFFGLSKSWNAFLLPIAILISVPQLNAVIHGTHVVMAHGMGSELAIDTYILVGAFGWLLTQVFPKREVVRAVIDGPGIQQAGWLVNKALMVIIVSLLVRGVAVGVTRYLGIPAPAYLDAFPAVFICGGLILGYGLVRLVLCWWPLFREPVRHKLFRHDPQWDEMVGPASVDEPPLIENRSCPG